VESAPRGEGDPAIGHAGPVESCGTPGGNADTVTLVGGGVGFAAVVEYAKQIKDCVVAEIDGEAAVCHQHYGETVGAVMLEVVDRRYVVAVFMNLNLAA
jgi:hypothetical protein